MSTFLVVLIFSIAFMSLAFLGLALKTIFKKGGQLTTCGGGGCGCRTTASCETANQTPGNKVEVLQLKIKD